jgi:uncharacterized membrane protein
MKKAALQSINEDSLNRMFVYDKRGELLFFPWGDNKPGYFIKSKSLEARIKKFYTSSFVVCIVMFLIGIAIFQDFWGFVGSLIVCFGGLYFVHRLYISRVVKSLPVAKVSYKDVVLEKFEPDDAEESDLQIS